MSLTYSLADWRQLMNDWTGWADVYLPVRTAAGWSWQPGAVDALDWLGLDYRPSDYPVKRWLLPARERLFSYSSDGGEVEVAEEVNLRPQIFVGLLPCDLTAIALLDRVYLAEPTDLWYQARRERTYLVGLTCSGPRDSACCCELLPTPTGSIADLFLTIENDQLSVEVGNSRGARLLGVSDSHRLAVEWGGPQGCDTSSLAATSVPLGYWEAQATTCLGCGACGLVCPTCLCYDLEDRTDADDQGGERWRTSDSCQLSHFALVAGGHDFRPTVTSRLQHRFRQKMEYLPERYGQVFCVGCGRCQRHCLAGHSMGDALRQRVPNV